MTTNDPPMPRPPAWTLVEKEKDYHARSKSGEVMSSGMLRKFRDCPYAYHLAVTGQAKEKDSSAYRFGRAVHKIVLEGVKAFNKAYAIGGPVNPRTGKCFAPGTQAFDAWLTENNASMESVISQEEADTLVTMANMAGRHAEASALLDFGWPELVARADLAGVPCQARLDWLTHDAEGNYLIVDVKTCDDMTWFLSDARKYQYPYQFAFYRDVVREASGIDARFAVVSLEKREPFRVGLWLTPPEELDYYGALNRAALEDFKACQVAGVWPTGYEAARPFAVERRGA